MKLLGLQIPFTKRSAWPPSPTDDRWFTPVFDINTTAAGQDVTPSTALKFSAVYAAVRVIAETLACVPIQVYKRRDDGGKDLARAHPVSRLLRGRPNRWMSSFQFREYMTGHLLLWGNCYAQIIRNGRGDPIELMVLHPSRMQPDIDEKGNLVYVFRMRDNTKKILQQAEVFHIANFTEEGIAGKSPVTLLREAIGLGLATEHYGAQFFANSARPSGVLEFPGKMDPQAKKQLKKDWDESQGANSSSSTAVLEGGMTWKTISMPADDAQFIQTRKMQIEEIARAFRVPLHMLGELSRSTHCLPADQEVFTEYGPKSIAKVEVGERVWSLDAAGNVVLSRVKQSVCSGLDTVLTIKAYGRTLRCNAKHRVLVWRQYLAPYSGGRGQSILVDGKKHRRAWKQEYIPAGEIQVGDSIVALSKLPDQGGTSCPTRGVVTTEFMEVLGMLLGDGCFFEANGKPAGFCISHPENADYLQHYVDAIAKEFTQYADAYGESNGNERPIPARKRDKHTTAFYSMKAYRELEALGVVGKSKTKEVPSWVFSLSNELKLALLRGYLDADGTVCKLGRASFCSVNKRMLEQMRHLCVSVGIKVNNLCESEIESEFNGKPYTHTLYKFQVSSAQESARIGSYTGIYHDRWQRAIASKQTRIVPIFPYETKKRELGEYLSPCLVREIVVSETPEPVFDLEVEATHSFIASCSAVHNSNIEQQSIDFIQHCMLSWFCRWEAAIQRDLLDPLDDTVFTEFLVEGLLRGDTLARHQVYAIQRQWGLASVNEIRGRENMNPIGPEGDIYLQPVNMAPAGSDPADQTQTDGSTDAVSSGSDNAPDGGAERAKVRQAFEEPVKETWARIIRKETGAVRKAAKGKHALGFAQWLPGFCSEHGEFATECMRSIYQAYRSVSGAPESHFEQVIAEYVSEVRQKASGFHEEPPTGYERNEAEVSVYWTDRLLHYTDETSLVTIAA